MKYKNYINKVSKDNRIYTNRDIADMTVRDAFNKKREILSQNRQIGIPTDYQMQNSSNVVWVNAYVREDGTNVKGHWRSKHGSINGNSNISQTDVDIIPDWKKVTKKEPWEEKSLDEKQKDGDFSDDTGEVEGSITSIVVNTAIDIAEILFPESEIVQTTKALQPLITKFVSKVFESEDGFGIDDGGSESKDDSSVLQEQDGTITGEASDIIRPDGIILTS